MKVVLTRTRAPVMDGVDVGDCRIGEVIDLPVRVARVLMADRWATPERRQRDAPPPVCERRGHELAVPQPGSEFREVTHMSRHTLLWELHHNHQPATDCEAWSENGAVRVLVRCDGRPDVETEFPDSKDAVRWAFDVEQKLIADGWTKFI
jgi:hypothetical protein